MIVAPQAMSASDAGTCKPTREVMCSGAVATGCVAGRRETIDCNRVLAGSACRSIVLAQGEALASACSGNDALTADGGPLADGCSGGDVRGSANGKTVFVSCRAQGLGNCRLVPVISQPPGQRNAACAPPADGG